MFFSLRLNIYRCSSTHFNVLLSWNSHSSLNRYKLSMLSLLYSFYSISSILDCFWMLDGRWATSVGCCRWLSRWTSPRRCRSGLSLTQLIFSAIYEPKYQPNYRSRLLVLRFVIVIESLMQPRYLLRSLPLNESQLLLLPSAKKRVFEDEHFVVLFYFVEIVHIKLGGRMFTCLTKEEKLECLKYLGSISLVKLRGSMTTNPMSSLSQQMIFLFSGCLVRWELPLVFRRFWVEKRRWYRCCGRKSCSAFSRLSFIVYNIIYKGRWQL